MEQILRDLVERDVLALRERLQGGEELRLGAPADGVLEKLGLPGRERNPDE